MINIGVFGYGYWGPNLVRNFFSTEGCTVKAVVDSSEDRLKKAQSQYPSLAVSTEASLIFDNNEIDAVVIALPVFCHFEYAKKALEKGKHVLLEKPMTSSKNEALELIELAHKKGKLLMVDHTFLYTGAVGKIKDLVDNDELGDIQYFDSVRINLGLFQSDINVIWDLAPHDISILQHIIDEKPVSVVATGASHTNNGIENIAYLTLKYKSGRIAHFTSSWTSPVKVRQILIGGTKKMIVFNDLEPTEKIKLYDTGYEVKSKEDERKMLVDYRVGDVYIPKVEHKEALKGLAEDFVRAVTTGESPISDYRSGLEVVEILEAADKSLRDGSREVML